MQPIGLVRPFAFLSLLAVSAAEVPAQVATSPNGDSAPRRLGEADVRLREPFSSISGVRELPGGRLLVSDARERRVVVVDAQGSVVRSIGREGRGPGEFVTPGGLYPVRGDSTLLFDRGQDRFLIIDEALEARDTRQPRAVRTGTVISDRDPYQVDSLGRVVRQERADPRESGEPPPGEWLVRFDPGRGHTDSIALLRIPERTVRRDGPITMTREQPFGLRDAWAVALDGRVALVRAAPYRVEWWQNGRVIARGPEVPYRPERVSAEDRAAYEEAQQRSSMRVSLGAPGGQRQSQVLRPSGAAPDFPAVKAPFAARAARVDAQGRVWVERSRAHDATESVHDVFDAGGRLIDRIALPVDQRIIGFGRGVVYTVVHDADDLEWILRTPY